MGMYKILKEYTEMPGPVGHEKLWATRRGFRIAS
jgi:hypothetical protein